MLKFCSRFSFCLLKQSGVTFRLQMLPQFSNCLRLERFPHLFLAEQEQKNIDEQDQEQVSFYSSAVAELVVFKPKLLL